MQQYCINLSICRTLHQNLVVPSKISDYELLEHMFNRKIEATPITMDLSICVDTEDAIQQMQQ